MRRRQFLATGTTLLSVALAGCGHPPVVLDMDEATAEDIAGEASMRPDPGSEEYTLATSALENGSATRNGSYELFDRTSTVEINSTFYEVSETRLSRSEETIYEVYIDVEPDDSTAELGEIAYDELPQTDRQRLESAVAEEPTPGDSRFVRSVEYGTAEEVGTDSVLVPERQYDSITHAGTRYGVAVNSRTAPEATYRYEVTEVAPDTEAFADQVRERYLSALTGLSDAEREVVAEAIESAYYEDDDAFRSVIDRFQAHDGLKEDGSYGTWLVEYEGTEYITYAEW